MASASQEKAQKAIDSLNAGIEDLIKSGKWAEYLATQVRFHNYSANNIMLIWLQKRDATQVAGYRKWQELGRQVRKGEKAIVILAPCVRKLEIEDRETGEKSEQRRVVGFTTANVFDISQTDGEDLPEIPNAHSFGNGDAALHAAIVALIAEEGYTYREASLKSVNGSPDGTTHDGSKTVTVEESLPLAQRVITAVHELAHVLLHSPEKVNYAADRGRCEVEAESIAYVVLHAAGYDAGAYSFGYVAGWSAGSIETVKAVAEVVNKTASKLLERLESTTAGEVVAA